MNTILDDFLVGLVLMASAGYAVFSLGPRGLRGRTFAALSRMMARAPAMFGLGRTARWLAAASADKSKGACGGCDSCGSEKAPASTGVVSGVTSVAASAAGMAEVRVPLAKIGKRTAGASNYINDEKLTSGSQFEERNSNEK